MVVTVSRLTFILAAGFLAGAGAILVAQPAGATVGGPDTCGYFMIDTAAGGGPAYNWVDISTTGSTGPIGDDTSVYVPIGFTFNVCGTNYTSVILSSNGHICFGSSFSYCSSTYGPSFIPGGCCYDTVPFVASYWTDIRTDCAICVAKYETQGTAPNRVFIYQMSNTIYYGSNAPAGSFEFKLFETSNNIEVHYGTMTTDGHTAVAGIMETPSSGLQYLQGTSISLWNALSNTAVRYSTIVNTAPTASPGTVNLKEDCNAALSTSGCATPATVTLTGTDPDVGDSRYYCVQAFPTHGTLADAPPPCPLFTTVSSPTLEIGYVPDADYCNGFGTFTPANNDFLTFKVKDNMATSTNTARIDLQVDCLADAPTATNDFYTLWENCSPIAGIGSCSAASPPYFAVGPGCGSPQPGLKCSAGERDGDDLQVPAPSPANVHSAAARVVLVDPPVYGVVRNYDGSGTGNSISDDGSFRYIPNNNNCGPDTFTYRLLDDNAPTGLIQPAYGNTATVTLTVTCTGTIPTAVADARTAAVGFTMDTALRALPSLMSNDYDPEGDPLTAMWCSGPTVGTLGGPGQTDNPPIRPNGHFRYTPPAGYTGPATFQYRVRDSTGHQSPCTTVQISVQFDNPPVAAFSWFPSEPNVGETTIFTDGSVDPDQGDGIAFWSWSFGDGLTSNQRSPGHNYGLPGSMHVCLTVADTYGQWGQPACRDVNVSPPPQQGAPPPQKAAPEELAQDQQAAQGELTVSAGDDILVAPGGSVTLQATSTGGSARTAYAWTQVDENMPVSLAGATSQQASFTAPTAVPPGGRLVYYFGVRATDGAQADEDGVQVIVQADRSAPTARIAGPRESAVGEPFELDASGSASGLPRDAQAGLTFRWVQVAGPATTIFGADTPTASVTPAEAGLYAFAVEVSDAGGSASAKHEVAVEAAPQTAEGDGFTIEILPGGTVVVTPTVAADEYTWTFDDGTTETSKGRHVHVYQSAGTYTIQMTARTGSEQAAFEREAEVPVSAARDVVGLDATAAVPVWAWGVGALVGLVLVGAAVAYVMGRRRALEPPGPV